MDKFDYVIDIQAFHDKDGKFHPKEIAVLSVECDIISHWLIKPPYDCSELSRGLLATNSYLSCYHHGIEWFDGESNLEDVYSALRDVARHAVRIYVRGVQKQQLLERILGRQIINLEEYRCPAFKKLSKTDEHFCFYHGKKKEYFNCAVAYVFKLRTWLLKSVYMRPDSGRDTPDQLSDKRAHEEKVDVLCEKVKKAGCEPVSPKRKARATPPPPAPITKKKSVDSVKRSSVEHLYENVEHEFASATACTQQDSGTDGRRFPGGQDTVCLGETQCACT